MAKVKGEQVLAELTLKMGDKIEKDLARFHLVADEMADADEMGKNYAASNIGAENAEFLERLAEEEYPYGEIKAWTKSAKKAIKLCEKYGIPANNRNVIIMHWHKGVI